MLYPAELRGLPIRQRAHRAPYIMRHPALREAATLQSGQASRVKE